MDGDRHVGIYDAGRYWHTDLSYMAVPSRGSLLHAIEIPHNAAGEPLGDTLFASTSAAYDALDANTKRRISELKAEFSLANRHAKLVADGDQGAALSDTHQDRAPARGPPGGAHAPDHGAQEHLRQRRPERPASWDFPKTKPVTCCTSCAHHCTRSEFVYRHRWRAGDLLMWDQHSDPSISPSATTRSRSAATSTGTTLRGTPPQ